MTKYLFLIFFLLVGCHHRAHYLALDDGLVLDKNTGDVFEVKADKTPPFIYVGNLNDFRKEKGLDKKRCH